MKSKETGKDLYQLNYLKNNQKNVRQCNDE